VTFRGRRIFDAPGLVITQFHEQENRGALLNVRTVLFKNIGITSGASTRARVAIIW